MYKTGIIMRDPSATSNVAIIKRGRRAGPNRWTDVNRDVKAKNILSSVAEGDARV